MKLPCFPFCQSVVRQFKGGGSAVEAGDLHLDRRALAEMLIGDLLPALGPGIPRSRFKPYRGPGRRGE